MAPVKFVCHDCGETFEKPVDNPWGIYEFTRCPTCGSARTTLPAETGG